MPDPDRIPPHRLRPLTGDEPLGPSTVVDFWRWALGDLRMNNARGYLVEFLVARALGDPSPLRVEWGPYDVHAADGTRVEVKAAGRLQSWTVKRPSVPRWSFPAVNAATVWDEALGEYVSVDPADRVHVWVFALHAVTDPATYDPLDVGQWEFRVVPHRRLLATGQTSAGLSFFERLAVAPVSYADLPAAVASARAEHDRLATRDPRR